MMSCVCSRCAPGGSRVCPECAPHSIYDELWHAATWQRIVVGRDKAAAGALSCGGANCPSAAPRAADAGRCTLRALGI